MVRRERFEVEVGAQQGPVDVTIVADLLTADETGRRPLVVCFPGGGMSRRYFDLPEDRPEGPPGRWSIATDLVERFGVDVAVVDHPGVGESSVPADPYLLTPRAVADLEHLAVASLVARVSERSGPTCVIGLGHSMGGLLVTHTQWHHRTYDALVLLGFGGAGLPDHLTAAESAFAGGGPGAYERLEPALAGLVAERFGAALTPGSTTSSDFLNPGVTTPGARELLGEASSSLLNLCGLTSMIPGASDEALASVQAPVFLGVGEFDITGDVDVVASSLSSSPAVTTFIVPGAGHNHAISDNRVQLWDAIGEWVVALER